jgi:hypothetical protein
LKSRILTVDSVSFAQNEKNGMGAEKGYNAEIILTTLCGAGISRITEMALQGATL